VLRAIAGPAAARPLRHPRPRQFGTHLSSAQPAERGRVQVSEALGVAKEVADRTISREKAFINNFFDKDGRTALLLYYQVPEELSADNEWVKRGSTPHLIVAQTPDQRLSGSAVYFVRTNPKGISEKTIADDVQCGCIKGSALGSLRSLVQVRGVAQSAIRAARARTPPAIVPQLRRLSRRTSSCPC